MIETKPVNGPNDKISIEIISIPQVVMDKWSKRLLNGQTDYCMIKHLKKINVVQVKIINTNQWFSGTGTCITFPVRRN